RHGAVAFVLRRLVVEFTGGLVLVGHALLESLHRLAQVAAGATQALGAEHQQHHDQHDQPMPDAETTHCMLPGTGEECSGYSTPRGATVSAAPLAGSGRLGQDRKSTRLNSSH